MNPFRFSTVLSILLAGSTALSQGLSGLKPGEWFEAPDSHLEAVKPDPLPNGSITAVMAAWSGGSYDSKRDKLIVWGGGHSDYAGNEVYAFDVNSLKWQRLSEPSTDVGGIESSGEYPDGTPRSRHTYDYVQYVPVIDRFCTFGGGGLYPSGQTGTAKTHCFDPAAAKWERKADAIGAGTGSLTAVDPATGMVWMQGAGSDVRFSSWDPGADKWTQYSTYSQGWLDYSLTAAIGGDKFLAIGGGHALLWNVENPDRQPVEPAMKGDTGILAVNCPGLAYDPVRGRFAAWAGGKDIYYLDPSTWTWTKEGPAPGNTVIPTTAEKNGTYGRFRYIPSRDLFIGVNRTNEDVFIFRPSQATGIVPRESGGRLMTSSYSTGIARDLYGGYLWRMSGPGTARGLDGRRLKASLVIGPRQSPGP